jgi:hypothetical protein
VGRGAAAAGIRSRPFYGPIVGHATRIPASPPFGKGLWTLLRRCPSALVAMTCHPDDRVVVSYEGWRSRCGTGPPLPLWCWPSCSAGPRGCPPGGGAGLAANDGLVRVAAADWTPPYGGPNSEPSRVVTGSRTAGQGRFMNPALVTAAEKLADEFPDQSTTTVTQVLVDCADEFPKATSCSSSRRPAHDCVRRASRKEVTFGHPGGTSGPAPPAQVRLDTEGRRRSSLLAN